MRSALELKPNDPELHHQLGIAYNGCDMINDAIRELEEAARIKKDHIQAHIALGYIYYKAGEIPQSNRRIQYVREPNP